ncbi:MAG TPA: class I SAM-dependent methyltransferase [Oscillospiraceae bacterium]|nr:class I SAM-dependent methyltransferase [Oscillospiraceae bacterium]
MKLTPRLQAIAELIPPGSVIADIGTDHAYLPIYLLLEQISQSAVAADINEAPLEQAQETVAAFNCHQKIDLRLGDGLEILQEADGVDTIVIAGLGGRTIASILETGSDKLRQLKRIILQPMNETGYLRLFLAKNGLAIVHEELVLEGKHLYEIILAHPGQEIEEDPFKLSLGPRLLEKKPPLLPLLLKEKIRKLRIVYHSLQRAKKKDVSGKIRDVQKELDCLQEVLAGATQRTDTD